MARRSWRITQKKNILIEKMTFKNDNCPEFKTILHLQVFGI